jgi:hypothetical protein
MQSGAEPEQSAPGHSAGKGVSFAGFSASCLNDTSKSFGRFTAVEQHRLNRLFGAPRDSSGIAQKHPAKKMCTPTKTITPTGKQR